MAERDYFYGRKSSQGPNISDDLIRMKIKVLKAKLDQERQTLESTDISSSYDLDEEVRRAKEKQLQLMSRLQAPPLPPPQQPRAKPPVKQESSSFEKYMEMILMQQTQTQNMIMNRLLLNTAPPNGVYGGPGYYFNTNGVAAYAPAAANVVQVPPPPPPVATYIPPPLHHHHPPLTPRPKSEHSYRSDCTMCNGNNRNANKSPPSSPGSVIDHPEPPIVPYPFPGNNAQRKLRQWGYVAMFCSLLVSEGEKQRFRPDSDFLFDIQIKEAINTCHRMYLMNDAEIFQIFQRAVVSVDAYDFMLLTVDKPTREQQQLVEETTQDLNYAIENITFQICGIMPKVGILGTHRKSALYEAIKNNKKYPDNYFYNMDRMLVSLDFNGRTINIDDLEASYLIIMIFFNKALITTILRKHVQYGLVGSQHLPKTDDNIRVMASVYLYIIRLILGDYLYEKDGQPQDPKSKKKRQAPPIPQVPEELSDYILPDSQMMPLYQRIDKSIQYSKDSIKSWAEAYVLQLRGATF